MSDVQGAERQGQPSASVQRHHLHHRMDAYLPFGPVVAPIQPGGVIVMSDGAKYKSARKGGNVRCAGGGARGGIDTATRRFCLDPHCKSSCQFFSENSSGERSLSKLEMLGGDIYGKAAHPKSRLADFRFRPPPQRQSQSSQNRRDHGRISEPSHDGIVRSGDVKTSEMPFVMF